MVEKPHPWLCWFKSLWCIKVKMIPCQRCDLPKYTDLILPMHQENTCTGIICSIISAHFLLSVKNQTLHKQEVYRSDVFKSASQSAIQRSFLSTEQRFMYTYIYTYISSKQSHRLHFCISSLRRQIKNLRIGISVGLRGKPCCFVLNWNPTQFQF